MNLINYSDALEIIENINTKDKIQFFLLKLESCPSCDEWLKYNLKELMEFICNDFDMYVIECDKDNIPFPPLSSPTLYFYHKNFQQPFIRQGFLPIFETTQHFSKFVRIKNGESYESVFK